MDTKKQYDYSNDDQEAIIFNDDDIQPLTSENFLGVSHDVSCEEEDDEEIQLTDEEDEEELQQPQQQKISHDGEKDTRTFDEIMAEMGIKTNAKGHYVNNEELYQHMVKYCEERDKALAEGKPKPRLDDVIGKAIMLIATRLAFRPNFVNYSYRAELTADAIENCLTYIDSFDPKKSKNPFAYITQICWCAFIRRLKIEKRQSVIKGLVMMNQDITDNMSFEDEDDQKLVHETKSNVHTYVLLAREEKEKQLKLQKERERAKEEKKLRKQQKENNLCDFFAN